MRRVRVVQTVLTPSREVEWAGAWVAAGFAIVLALPGSSFGLSPAWSRMAAVMPEGVWAVVVGGVAAIRMAALLINGHWRRTPLLRAGTAAIGAGLWTYVAMLLLRPEWTQVTGFATYGVIAVFEFRSALRAGRDAAIAAKVAAMLAASGPPADFHWRVAP